MFFVPLFVFASTTDGTIDSTYKYAWSENVGWINFGTSEGNVHVTDTAVTGYMWNENTGWINLAVSGSVYVANNADGTLSGYAWGEGVGYINFAGVTIDSDGFFHGYASSTLSGRINFNCIDLNTCGTSDFRTKTDWRKASVRNASSGSSSGGGGGGGATRSFSQQVVVQSTPVVTTVAPVSVPASSLSEGGLSGNLRPGDSGPRVTALQKFLNSQGYVVSASGAGSPGKERISVILQKQLSVNFSWLVEMRK
jgi:hypothetical protein